MVDNFSGAYNAICYLINNSHRRIAHIGGSMTSKVFRERFEGYKKALIDHHIDPDHRLIRETRLTKEDCCLVLKDILACKNPPNAALCANNLTAITTIFYAQSVGLHIPDDLAVIGFSVDPFSMLMKPSLTAVQQPVQEMGKMAIESLVDELECHARQRTAVYQEIILATKLVLRESSG